MIKLKELLLEKKRFKGKKPSHADIIQYIEDEGWGGKAIKPDGNPTAKAYQQAYDELMAEQKQPVNEELKRGFMVHSDPDATEKDWKSQFKLLAQGHPQPISYGPRESDIYDWNDRSNYRDAIIEYNKYMTGISIKLNAAVKDMNNIWKVWDKISNKYRKKDGGR